MNDKILLICLAALLPNLAFSQGVEKYQCTYGDMTRRVEILHEGAELVPCEVHYYKDTESPGSDELLWHAGADSGYCEEKTLEFVAKLRGWGWDCGHGDDAMADPDQSSAMDDVDPGDDTTDLAPADAADTDEDP
jgi:hypothetical protein